MNSIIRKPTTPLAVSIDEAARLMGISARTVRRLIAAGRLSTRTIGRRVVVRMAAIEGFIAASQPHEDGR